MEISFDYTVYHTDVMRYVILCRNMMCIFLMAVTYWKRSDSWEIGSMDPPHTCIITNPMQNNHKLSSQIICQEILPLISKDLSLKVSTIICHIITRYNYTSSYKKS